MKKEIGQFGKCERVEMSLMDLYDVETHQYTGSFPVDRGAVEAITASIEAEGLQSPLSLLRKKDGDGYILIDGQNRLSALENMYYMETEDEIKAFKVPCFVYDKMDDLDVAAFVSAANFARRDLSAIQRAAIGLKIWGENLKGLAGRPKKGDDIMTVEEIGRRVGVSRGTLFSVKGLLDQCTGDDDKYQCVMDGLVDFGDNLKKVASDYGLALYKPGAAAGPLPVPLGDVPAAKENGYTGTHEATDMVERGGNADFSGGVDVPVDVLATDKECTVDGVPVKPAVVSPETEGCKHTCAECRAKAMRMAELVAEVSKVQDRIKGCQQRVHDLCTLVSSFAVSNTAVFLPVFEASDISTAELPSSARVAIREFVKTENAKAKKPAAKKKAKAKAKK